MTSLRKINCPQCNKPTIYSTENSFRPFCSERCRLIDLGQWANEDFRIPSQDSGSIQELAEQLEELEQKDSQRDSKQ